jgi:hypothetical protein
MEQFRIGDRVFIKGDSQSYILIDPTRTYTGVVIGMGDGQLLVRLDEPVTPTSARAAVIATNAQSILTILSCSGIAIDSHQLQR